MYMYVKYRQDLHIATGATGGYFCLILITFVCYSFIIHTPLILLPTGSDKPLKSFIVVEMCWTFLLFRSWIVYTKIY